MLNVTYVYSFARLAGRSCLLVSYAVTAVVMASAPAERGRLGAHVSWARTPDRAARTRPARQAFLAKFEKEVDPDGLLSQEERTIRAEHAMKAHMARIRLARGTRHCSTRADRRS